MKDTLGVSPSKGNHLICVSDWLKADRCILTCANRSTIKLKRIGRRSHKLHCRLKDVEVLGCLFKQFCSTLPIQREKLYRTATVVILTCMSVSTFSLFLSELKKREESRVSFLWKKCSYKTCALSGGKRVLSNIPLVTNESQIKNENTSRFFLATFVQLNYTVGNCFHKSKQ